uniref:Uncharacterized protein n=1 Tax=Arundo donax TaxID=35708 RepID=A0A0A9EFF1_ARUDO
MALSQFIILLFLFKSKAKDSLEVTKYFFPSIAVELLWGKFSDLQLNRGILFFSYL